MRFIRTPVYYYGMVDHRADRGEEGDQGRNGKERRRDEAEDDNVLDYTLRCGALQCI